MGYVEGSNYAIAAIEEIVDEAIKSGRNRIFINTGLLPAGRFSVLKGGVRIGQKAFKSRQYNPTAGKHPT